MPSPKSILDNLPDSLQACGVIYSVNSGHTGGGFHWNIDESPNVPDGVGHAGVAGNAVTFEQAMIEIAEIAANCGQYRAFELFWSDGLPIDQALKKALKDALKVQTKKQRQENRPLYLIEAYCAMINSRAMPGKTVKPSVLRAKIVEAIHSFADIYEISNSTAWTYFGDFSRAVESSVMDSDFDSLTDGYSRFFQGEIPHIIGAMVKTTNTRKRTPIDIHEGSGTMAIS